MGRDWTTPPPVPVTVSVKEVADVPAVADTVKAVVPLPGAAMVAGERLAVTPLGAPLTERAIAEANRYSAVVDSVICVDFAATTLALVRFEAPCRVNVGDKIVTPTA